LEKKTNPDFASVSILNPANHYFLSILAAKFSKSKNNLFWSFFFFINPKEIFWQRNSHTDKKKLLEKCGLQDEK